MNHDLMLAVMSMHAYNDDKLFNQIGDATVSKTAEDGSGFYAKAYSYAGETIISYRGTDGYYFGDAWYGWGTGLGTGSTQATMATQF